MAAIPAGIEIRMATIQKSKINNLQSTHLSLLIVHPALIRADSQMWCAHTLSFR
jgi:hypothetical protein